MWGGMTDHDHLSIADTDPAELADNRELVRENAVLRSNSDHLSSENASLSRQVESMAMRIESLAEELAKPEDVRLREVIDALDGRAVIFDGLGARVGHLLDEMDEWIERAGEAERAVDEWKAANGYNDLLAVYSASVSETNRLRKLFDDAKALLEQSARLFAAGEMDTEELGKAA